MTMVKELQEEMSWSGSCGCGVTAGTGGCRVAMGTQDSASTH